MKLSADRLHPGIAGASFVEMPPDHPLSGRVGGVVVKDVQPESPAARAGLLPGDVVSSVNRRPVDSLAALQSLAGPRNEQVLLQVRRGHGAFFVLIQ
jgi:S1-C subfamily serine protease